MKSFISLSKGNTFDTFFDKENVALVNSLGETLWNTSEHCITTEQVAERIGECENYVTLWGSPRLDSEILKNAPNLKLLTHLGGTVVPFVSEEMWERGIKVISANDYFAESVAEGTLAYILCALRDIPKYSRELKEQKKWKTSLSYTAGLMGKTVGLVSYGNYGFLWLYQVMLFGTDTVNLDASRIISRGTVPVLVVHGLSDGQVDSSSILSNKDQIDSELVEYLLCDAGHTDLIYDADGTANDALMESIHKFLLRSING